MKLLILSCSLNPQSRSAILAAKAESLLKEKGADVELLDLRTLTLPLCDGATVYGDPQVQELGAKVTAATGILVAAPVYNYDVNAAAKNVVELTGKAWTEKVVGLLLAAGGQGSYMSAMPFANSLMLDFRCSVIPRFVYATGADFAGDTIRDPEVVERLSELADVFIQRSQVAAEASEG